MEVQAMSKKNEMKQKRDENVPAGDRHIEEACSQPARPTGASALPFRQLHNSSHSSPKGTSKDRLRQFCHKVFKDSAPPPPLPRGQENPQFCHKVFKDSAPPPPLPRGQENPQVVGAGYTKPKPVGCADTDHGCSEALTPGPPVQCQQPSGIARATTGHVYTGKASPKAAVVSECQAQCQQPSGIPRAIGGPRTHRAGGDYRVLQSTPNASPGLGESIAAVGSHKTDGSTDIADTSTSSGTRCSHLPLVPDMSSPDFDKYRELLRQDRLECYHRDSIRSPFSAVDDLSPGLTPPHAAPLPALNSMRDVQQIIAVPLPDSPAHYTDSPKQLEDSPTTEFKLPVSVTWKRRQHGRCRSSATPPGVSPGIRMGHLEASPKAEERDSSDERNGSGSNTSRGGGSPGVIVSGFRTPDLDSVCRRVRADMAKLYNISPWLSPAESVDSFGEDMAKHHSMSPHLSPANSIKTAAPVEVRDGATMSSPFPSPPLLLARDRTGPAANLAARHCLSTVMECSQEISYSTICGTTALGPVMEESLLIDARQPTLVDATFGAWMPTTMTSQLGGMGEELPADPMSDSLASFMEHERIMNAEFDINDSA